MEQVTFGRTGVTVSRLGFGGAPAGLANYLDAYSPTDARQRREVIEAIQRAVELGITYFDTAPGYGGGESERIFGEALEGIGRSGFCGHQNWPGLRRTFGPALKPVSATFAATG